MELWKDAQNVWVAPDSDCVPSAERGYDVDRASLLLHYAVLRNSVCREAAFFAVACCDVCDV